MKSWDRRGWWKSADICQMLWVFAQVADEAEAKIVSLPSIINPTTYQYPHGLTPPMQFARSRRFRKRLHKSQIEEVEDAVERLLNADNEAESTRWDFIDPDAEDRRASRPYSPATSPGGYEIGGERYSEDEDAEGDLDEPQYFDQTHNLPNNYTNGHGEVNEDFDLEADMEAEFEAAATPISTSAATPSMPIVTEGEEVDSGDESIDDDDDDDDEDDEDEGAEEISEEERARLALIQGTKEDIAELERAIAEQQAKLSTTPNAILRNRVEQTIRNMKQDLQLKKSSIGEGDENE
jgi:transcription initiation factor TFIID subunit 7